MVSEKFSKEIMSLAPWRSPLGKAQHINRSLANVRFLQLATVRPDGRPANRTVVFRGFVEETNQMKFVTDFRSQKVTDLYEQPWGEACWYFSKTREQFRLHGRLALITSESIDEAEQQLRSRTWNDLSRTAKAQFTWPAPGQIRPYIDPLNLIVDEDQPVLPDFCVLILDPISVDHLQLKSSEGQLRTRYDRSPGGVWSIVDLNP